MVGSHLAHDREYLIRRVYESETLGKTEKEGRRQSGMPNEGRSREERN